ncbi:MAG: molybdopterin-synthase adenylyltransferase MoeB, partial [Gemmatimonadota bacterium]|nr:molybdopterin-synthase adenylyltransferase MoeB [Gemmatimonadota bacterium]
PPPLSPPELYRYARHLALPHLGMEGQQRLKEGRVLCVGTGGLGSPLALYLAAAGVGTLGLVDFDVVDASNLQRQIIHGTSDVGRPKIESARDRIREVNPHVEVVLHDTRLTASNALGILAGYDVVVDGTDNFPTRYLVNDACVILGKPNVYGSIFRWEGQASVFGVPGEPCYRCLFREPPPPGLVPNCAEGGVLGALPGVIGSLQAMETVKLLTGAGESLAGRLLIFDALEMSWREIRLARNPECPVCGDQPTQAGLIDYDLFCGVGPAAADGPASPVPSVPTLTPREAAALLGGEDPPLLVDVRDPWEWSAGNLGAMGALHVPLASLEERMDEITGPAAGRAVIVCCRVGERSARAAVRLIQAGVPNVYNLRGGLLEWARTVDPDVVVL